MFATACAHSSLGHISIFKRCNVLVSTEILFCRDFGSTTSFGVLLYFNSGHNQFNKEGVLTACLLAKNFS